MKAGLRPAVYTYIVTTTLPTYFRECFKYWYYAVISIYSLIVLASFNIGELTFHFLIFKISLVSVLLLDKSIVQKKLIVKMFALEF